MVWLGVDCLKVDFVVVLCVVVFKMEGDRLGWCVINVFDIVDCVCFCVGVGVVNYMWVFNVY